MPDSYKRKTVIVTGGSRGIGAATVKYFANNNYNVVINYVSNDEAAENLKKEIENNYKVEALTIKANVKEENEVKELVNKVINKFGNIDCLINNAGIAIDSTLEDKTVENFQEVLNVNLIGTFLMCKYVGEVMLKQGYGSIVNISSTNGIDSFYSYSMDYDASKAGVISLSHNFANLYAPTIRVNTIAPGWVNTEMNKELDDEYKNEECKHILLNRFAEPEEIADLIFYVADKNIYLNDSVIKIDGGRC